MSKARRALFVDLDGTVRKSPQEIGRPLREAGDIEIHPGVPELLARYREEGWRIVGYTCEGDVSLGLINVDRVAQLLMETAYLCGDAFDKIMICFHHPDADDPEWARCWCRKPRIGMIVEGARDLGETFGEYYPPHLALVVGDEEDDRLLAEAANIDFRHAREWRSEI